MAKPRYRQNIENFAQRIGQDPAEMLDSISQQARVRHDSDQECFLPDEMVQYERTRILPQDRVDHIRTCPGCAALVHALVPGVPFDRPLSEEKLPIHEQLVPGFADAPGSRLSAQHFSFFRMVGVAAAFLIVSIVSIRISPRGNYSGPIEVRLTFSGSGGPESVTVPVTVQDGKLVSASYVDVAAATAVAEGAAESGKSTTGKSQGFVNSGLSSGDLQTVSSALAAAFQEKSGGDLDPPQIRLEQRDDVLRALVHSFANSNSNVNVEYLSSGDVGLFRDRQRVGLITPETAFLMTRTFTEILRVNKGDTKALDTQLKNVSFSLVAGENQKGGLPRR